MTKKQIIEASKDNKLILNEKGFFIDGVNVTKQMDKLAKLNFKDFEDCYLNDVWAYYVRGFQLHQDSYLHSIPNIAMFRDSWFIETRIL